MFNRHLFGTNRELAVKLMELKRKWQKGCTSKEELQEIVGKEQFCKTLGNIEKKLQVMELSAKTCVEAEEFADEYEQARLQEPRQEKTLTQDPCTKEVNASGGAIAKMRFLRSNRAFD